MAESTLGKLNVIIGANVKGLIAGTKKAQRELTLTGSSALKLTKELRNLAIQGIATGGVVVALAAHSARMARELKSLAQVAGTTTTELQKQAFAAKTVGIQQQKLADIYKDAQDKVGDFLTTGGGPLLDFFEKVAPLVNTTAKEFKNLTGPEVLQKLKNDMDAAGISMQKQIFHLEALASDASMLIPLLQDNGTEFKRLGQIAEDTGQVLSELEVEQLKIMGDDLQTVTGIMADFKDRVAVKLSPIIHGIAKNFIIAATETQGFQHSVEQAFTVGIKFAGVFGDALMGVRLTQIAIAGGFVKLSELASKPMAGLEKVAFNLSAMQMKLLDNLGLLPQVQAHLDAMEDSQSPLRDWDQNAEDARLAFEALRQEWDELANSKLPSEQLEEWVARQTELYNQETAALLANQQARLAALGDGEGNGEDPFIQAQREQMETKLQILRESLLTEEQAENESFNRRLAALQEFRDNDLISQRERDNLVESEILRHEKRINDIKEHANRQRRSMEEKTTSLAIGLLNQFAGESKAAAIAGIALTKALEIARTIQATATASVLAYASQLIPGDPTSIARATAAAASTRAFGAAQVALIAATGLAQASGVGGGGGGGFGGGGGGGFGGGSVSSGGGGVSPQTGDNEGSPTNFLDVSISGIGASDMFSGQQVRDLIGKINEEVEDGAIIRSVRAN